MQINIVKFWNIFSFELLDFIKTRGQNRIMAVKVVGFKISEKSTSIEKERFTDRNGNINYVNLIKEVDNRGKKMFEESRLFGRI